MEYQSFYEIANNVSIGNQYFDGGGGYELQYAALKEQNYPEIRVTSDFENAIIKCNA